jgi:hypothetical protein
MTRADAPHLAGEFDSKQRPCAAKNKAWEAVTMERSRSHAIARQTLDRPWSK